MTTCDNIESRLSEYIDGDVDAALRATIAAHLASCERCSGLAVDFERLRTTARSLGPVTPPPGSWASIAARLESAPTDDHATTTRWSWPGLAMAAALVLIVGGTTFVVRQVRPASTTAADARTASATAPASVGDELALAMQHYDTAIADLQASATSAQTKLDPAIAATLKHNLGVIDHAIAESRSAVTDDPTSVAARDSLFDALQQKVTVLQDTVNLINDTRDPEAGSGRGPLR